MLSLFLTYKVNLGLSLRKTAPALKDIHGITISHQQVANYCKTASVCIKPFVDNYDLALRVAYYNFLSPHKHNNYKVLNEVKMLSQADTMPDKWKLLFFLGQETTRS